MVKAVFDTNILIDHLNGVEAAKHELERYDHRAVSIVTWMEVLIGADDAVRDATRMFLDEFDLVPLNETVAERAIALRRRDRMRLPDAVILASAETSGALLVTRNTKDFDETSPGVRVPYRL